MKHAAVSEVSAVLLVNLATQIGTEMNVIYHATRSQTAAVTDDALDWMGHAFVSQGGCHQTAMSQWGLLAFARSIDSTSIVGPSATKSPIAAVMDDALESTGRVCASTGGGTKTAMCQVPCTCARSVYSAIIAGQRAMS